MNIREMRNKLGDTQSEFAARYHIPFRTVQNWETGQRKPPEYIMKLLESRIREDLVNRNTTSGGDLSTPLSAASWRTR